LSSSTYERFRKKLATAAGAPPSQVFIHNVHQHTAPYIDGDAYRLLRKAGNTPLLASDKFLEEVSSRLAQAGREALASLQPFDHMGAGQAAVEQVASARRVFANGKLVTRYSVGGKDPAIAALPEGAIDTAVKTVTFAIGDKPLARLHYYATHPQTFCCDGRVSQDFVGTAREALEREEGVFQIYFTGCSGDVTVGKYNDGSGAAREGLAERLLEGMREAIGATRLKPAGRLRWRATSLKLPLKTDPDSTPAALREIIGSEGRSAIERYRTAIAAAFAEREQPLEVSSLDAGDIRIVHLPGEPMLEFQKFAQAQSPGSFVAVAGYGDMSPGYLCTDAAFKEGGYEPSASNAGPGTEARVKEAIRNVLGR
jgi:hypothetical protein